MPPRGHDGSRRAGCRASSLRARSRSTLARRLQWLAPRAPHRGPSPRAAPIVPSVERRRAQRARPLFGRRSSGRQLSFRPVVFCGPRAALARITAAPSAEQAGQPVDGADRLVGATPTTNGSSTAYTFPNPAALRWSSRAPASGSSTASRGGPGPRRGPAARGRRGRDRGGRRCAPPGRSRTTPTIGTSSPVRRPSSIHSSTRRRHSGSVAAGPTRHEPSMRRWACRVRPSSKRISRCLPWASAPGSTAPARSTPTSRGSRVTQRSTALAGEATVDLLGQPADGVTLRHPARCSAASWRRRPR